MKQSKATQNKGNTRERRHDISANQTPGGYKFAPLVAMSTRASEPARARLLWAILSLVLPVTFGHTTACRSPALVFSATIHFAIKYSAPCSAVLRHSPSSWAAVVHWSALVPKALRSYRKHTLFPGPPHSPRPPPFLRTSRTSVYCTSI